MGKETMAIHIHGRLHQDFLLDVLGRKGYYQEYYLPDLTNNFLVLHFGANPLRLHYDSRTLLSDVKKDYKVVTTDDLYKDLIVKGTEL